MIYITIAGENSEEYRTISRKLDMRVEPYTPAIGESTNVPGLVIGALQLLHEPTLQEIEDLYRRTPSGQQETVQRSLEAGTIRNTLASLLHCSVSEIGTVTAPALSSTATKLPIEVVRSEDKTVYRLSRLGSIAAAYGVDTRTCEKFYEWLHNNTERQAWHVLDILSLIYASVDGRTLGLVYTSKDKEADSRVDEELIRLKTQATGVFGNDWEQNSEFGKYSFNPRAKATIVSLIDWSKGHRVFSNNSEKRDIGNRYGLLNGRNNLSDQGRNVARLIRVLSAVAELIPEGTYPQDRPKKLASLATGVVSIPHDLDALADQMLYGMPDEAVGIAKLNIFRLSRPATMHLYRKVLAVQTNTSLPLLEHVSEFCKDTEQFNAAIPIAGLRGRILQALEAFAKAPLGVQLRSDPAIAREYYSHPLVRQAIIAQGIDHLTPIRVQTRHGYSVMRRNATQGEKIQITNDEQFAYWRDHGGIEFLRETGRIFTPGNGEPFFGANEYFVDLDPRNGYSLGDQKVVVRDIVQQLSEINLVKKDEIKVYWSGGKGFHIVAPLKGVYRRIEEVKGKLQSHLAPVCDDATVFLAEQKAHFDPYLILDLAPVMRRGCYRSVFSIHAGGGKFCKVPVSLETLDQFDPEKHATIQRVRAVFEQIPVREEPYSLAEIEERFLAAQASLPIQ